MKASAKYKGKDMTNAGLLALFLGWLGIHHFYLGNYIRGVLYLLFFWTTIPFFLSIIDSFIIFLKYTEGKSTFAGGCADI